VIPAGRDGQRFRPGAKQPFILCSGRLWDGAKGLSDLIACARTLAWPIRVAGATPLPIDDPEGLCDVDVPPEVELLGELSPEELDGHLARASIYAAPARYEPFGVSILEAALAGCALVLGDIPSLREVWGDTAIYVEPGDRIALGRALAELICAPTRRCAIAQRSRARALALTPQRMAAAYRAVYERLVETSPREVCA
jgi:glycosyltransferase involved in cell wall biosynthesis